MKLQSAETLRALMNQKDFSRRRLARCCGLSGSGMIDHLLDGRRNSCSPRLASLIAENLDVPISLLFLEKSPTTSRSVANQQAPSPVAEPVQTSA